MQLGPFKNKLDSYSNITLHEVTPSAIGLSIDNTLIDLGIHKESDYEIEISAISAEIEWEIEVRVGQDGFEFMGVYIKQVSVDCEFDWFPPDAPYDSDPKEHYFERTWKFSSLKDWDYDIQYDNDDKLPIGEWISPVDLYINFKDKNVQIEF